MLTHGVVMNDKNQEGCSMISRKFFFLLWTDREEKEGERQAAREGQTGSLLRKEPDAGQGPQAGASPSAA